MFFYMKMNIFMKMKKLYLSLMACFFVLAVSAQSFRYQGFSGGMMLHAGYVQSKSSQAYFEGYQSLCQGVGGAARVHLGKYLRLGGEGYVSSANYDANESYVSLGWGGVLADVALPLKKWTLYAGGSFGGGSVQHLQRNRPLENDFIPDLSSNYRHYATMLLTPYVGVEYALNDGIHLTAKIDYAMPMAKDKQSICDFPLGPRLYIGFLFYHTNP